MNTTAMVLGFIGKLYCSILGGPLRASTEARARNAHLLVDHEPLAASKRRSIHLKSFNQETPPYRCARAGFQDGF